MDNSTFYLHLFPNFIGQNNDQTLSHFIFWNYIKTFQSCHFIDQLCIDLIVSLIFLPVNYIFYILLYFKLSSLLLSYSHL